MKKKLHKNLIKMVYVQKRKSKGINGGRYRLQEKELNGAKMKPECQIVRFDTELK